jgi:hypothetical protein
LEVHHSFPVYFTIGKNNDKDLVLNFNQFPVVVNTYGVSLFGWSKLYYAYKKELNIFAGYRIFRSENFVDELFTLKFRSGNGGKKFNANPGSSVFLHELYGDEKIEFVGIKDSKEGKRTDVVCKNDEIIKDSDGSDIYIIRKVDIVKKVVSDVDGSGSLTLNGQTTVELKVTVKDVPQKKKDGKNESKPTKAVTGYVKNVVDKNLLKVTVSGPSGTYELKSTKDTFKGQVKEKGKYSVKVDLPFNKENFHCKISSANGTILAQVQTKSKDEKAVSLSLSEYFTVEDKQPEVKEITIECSNALMVQMTVLFGVMMAYLL